MLKDAIAKAAEAMLRVGGEAEKGPKPRYAVVSRYHDDTPGVQNWHWHRDRLTGSRTKVPRMITRVALIDRNKYDARGRKRA